jgi:hypothetical protein
MPKSWHGRGDMVRDLPLAFHGTLVCTLRKRWRSILRVTTFSDVDEAAQTDRVSFDPLAYAQHRDVMNPPQGMS